jgi:predicted dehydrogenase
MARFRFVLLGTGFYAQKWLEALKARQDCEVIGLASRTRTPAEELQRDFSLSGATLYADWKEAVTQGKADGVIITLPQTLHPEAAVREKRQPETHVAEHIRSLALLLAVAESSRLGRPVEVAELTGFLG